MSNRALRRAAERQSRKQAQKQSREQTLVAAVGADSAQPISNPPSTIQNHDPQNTAPLPQHLLKRHRRCRHPQRSGLLSSIPLASPTGRQSRQRKTLLGTGNRGW